jgi:hypothetical protein
MERRVERVESGPMLSLLFSPRPGIEVLDEQEDQLSSGSNRAIGILKFALQTRPGEPLPPGNYTVEITEPGPVAAQEPWRPASPLWPRGKEARGLVEGGFFDTMCCGRCRIIETAWRIFVGRDGCASRM